MKKRDFRRGEQNSPQVFEALGHPADAARESGLQGPQRAAVIDGAERFGKTRRTGGQHGIRANPLCGFEQSAQESGRDFRHVASRYQVPLRPAVRQRGQDAAQRSFARIQIGDDGKVIDPPFAEQFEGQPRQQLPKFYLREGSVYLTRMDVLMSQHSLKGKDCRAWLIPEERAWNIDTPFDLFIVEQMMKASLRETAKRQETAKLQETANGQ